MNMTIGVLVEVVSAASAIERQSMDVTFLRDSILRIMRDHDFDVDEPANMTMTKASFLALLNIPAAIEVLHHTDVDTVALIDFIDLIFVRPTMTFAEVMQEVLELRSSNRAKVKDLVDLRRYIVKEL